ncbi:hypothetical protein PV703_15555 [Streptomyces sp. ME01-24h]|nr:hypothetical protein [Streptomyces sp. ME01-24h]
MLDQGVGGATVAKAYQVLRAIMNTAVDDGLVQRNPCRIKGGATAPSAERPFLSVAEVFRLADAVPARYRVNQHLVNGRDHEIAGHVDDQIRRVKGPDVGDPSGT